MYYVHKKGIQSIEFCLVIIYHSRFCRDLVECERITHFYQESKSYLRFEICYSVQYIMFVFYIKHIFILSLFSTFI